MSHHHCGEISYTVKLKHDLHVSARETLIAPTHVVVAGPHVVHVALCEIVQSAHAIRQLAQSLCHTGNRDRTEEME